MASEFFRSAAVPVENTRSPAGSGPVSEDERGRLFVICRDGTLRSTDSRKVVACAWSPSSTVGPLPSRTFVPQPQLPFSPSALAVNLSGELAAVTGAVPPPSKAAPAPAASASASGGVNRYGLAVLELSAAPLASSSSSSASSSEPPAPCPARGGGDGGAMLLPIGASVMRMAWHPLSETHLLVLLSDGSLRMYCAARSGLLLEQEWFLCPRGAPAGGALREALPPDPPAVDFAFFAQHGWGAAALLLLFRDGSLRALCPVLPWGALVPAPLAASFFAADATTEQWLQATLQPAKAQQHGGGGGLAGSGMSALKARPGARSAAGGAPSPAPVAAGMRRIAPAALPAAAPALQGPLLLDADNSLAPPAALGPALSLAVAPLSTFRTDAGAIVAVAHSTRLRVFILPEAPTPRWARTAVSTERSLDGTLRRARMSAIGGGAAGSGEAAQQCIPVDDIELQAPAAGSAAAAAGARLCSLVWEGPPERRLFARHGGKVFAVTLPWLSSAERLLSDGLGGSADGIDGAAPDPADAEAFPLPVIQTVVDSPQLAAAVLLRDPLCEGSLLALGPDGDVRFAVAEPLLPPQGPLGLGDGTAAAAGPGGGGAAASPLGSPLRPATPPGSPAPPPAHALGALAAAIEGPDTAAPKAAASGTAEAPEAQKALAEAAAELRLRYVKWAHRAHEDVSLKAAELGTEGARQVAQLAALRERVEEAAARGEEVERRLRACQALHDNLRDRARLLGDLARDRPRKLTEEERAVAARLRDMISGPDSLVRVLAARLEELRRRSEALAAAGGDAATLKGHLVPAAHMQRVQAALSKNAALIAANAEKVKRIEAALAEEKKGKGAGLDERLDDWEVVATPG